MKKEIKILIVLFIVALIIRVVFSFADAVLWWDEAVYANLGYDLSNNPLHYSLKNAGWGDFIPSGGDDFYAWPKIGFRAPLLPYFLSIFYLFNLNFLINFFIPLIGALSVCLVYILGRKLFNEKIALYSAIFFLLIPLHVIYSAKILTDVFFTFFILLTFLSFWKGYEEGDKKYKVLFGVFLALSFLSRYTALWIMPVFLLYFLIRNKSLKFLKDKYLWYAIGIFFLILIPWFIYGISEYDNLLGAIIHGMKASRYWGGIQPWHFFFDYWWKMFSIIGFVFIIGLIYVLYRKEFLKKEIYLLLIWFALFLGMAIYMPHKEDRFILAIVPTIALISGYFLDKIKKYEKIILVGIILITLFSLSSQFYMSYNNSYTDTNKCFLEANKFLEKQDNVLIITDETAVVYYYTKQRTTFYPVPWNLEDLKNLINNNENAYIFFKNSYEDKIKQDLENNFEKVFECGKDEKFSIVYKFS